MADKQSSNEAMTLELLSTLTNEQFCQVMKKFMNRENSPQNESPPSNSTKQRTLDNWLRKTKPVNKNETCTSPNPVPQISNVNDSCKSISMEHSSSICNSTVLSENSPEKQSDDELLSNQLTNDDVPPMLFNETSNSEVIHLEVTGNMPLDGSESAASEGGSPPVLAKYAEAETIPVEVEKTNMSLRSSRKGVCKLNRRILRSDTVKNKTGTKNLCLETSTNPKVNMRQARQSSITKSSSKIAIATEKREATEKWNLSTIDSSDSSLSEENATGNIAVSPTQRIDKYCKRRKIVSPPCLRECDNQVKQMKDEKNLNSVRKRLTAVLENDPDSCSTSLNKDSLFQNEKPINCIHEKVKTRKPNTDDHNQVEKSSCRNNSKNNKSVPGDSKINSVELICNQSTEYINTEKRKKRKKYDEASKPEEHVISSSQSENEQSPKKHERIKSQKLNNLESSPVNHGELISSDIGENEEPFVNDVDKQQSVLEEVINHCENENEQSSKKKPSVNHFESPPLKSVKQNSSEKVKKSNNCSNLAEESVRNIDQNSYTKADELELRSGDSLENNRLHVVSEEQYTETFQPSSDVKEAFRSNEVLQIVTEELLVDDTDKQHAQEIINSSQDNNEQSPKNSKIKKSPNVNCLERSPLKSVKKNSKVVGVKGKATKKLTSEELIKQNVRYISEVIFPKKHELASSNGDSLKNNGLHIEEQCVENPLPSLNDNQILQIESEKQSILDADKPESVVDEVLNNSQDENYQSAKKHKKRKSSNVSHLKSSLKNVKQNSRATAGGKKKINTNASHYAECAERNVRNIDQTEYPNGNDLKSSSEDLLKNNELHIEMPQLSSDVSKAFKNKEIMQNETEEMLVGVNVNKQESIVEEIMNKSQDENEVSPKKHKRMKPEKVNHLQSSSLNRVEQKTLLTPNAKESFMKKKVLQIETGELLGDSDKQHSIVDEVTNSSESKTEQPPKKHKKNKSSNVNSFKSSPLKSVKLKPKAIKKRKMGNVSNCDEKNNRRTNQNISPKTHELELNSVELLKNNDLHIESEEQYVETSQSSPGVKEIFKNKKVLKIEIEKLVVDDPNWQQSIVKDMVNHSENKNVQSPKKYKQNKSPNSDDLKSPVKCVKQGSNAAVKKRKMNNVSDCAQENIVNSDQNIYPKHRAEEKYAEENDENSDQNISSKARELESGMGDFLENNESRIKSKEQYVEKPRSALVVKEIFKSKKRLQIEIEKLIVDDPDRQQSIVEEIVNHSKNENERPRKKPKRKKTTNSNHLKSPVKCAKQNSRAGVQNIERNNVSDCDEENVANSDQNISKKAHELESNMGDLLENDELHIESEERCVKMSQSPLDVKELLKKEKVLQVEIEEQIVDDPDKHKQQSVVEEIVYHSENENGPPRIKHKRNKTTTVNYLKTPVKCVKQNSRAAVKKRKTNRVSDCTEENLENSDQNISPKAHKLESSIDDLLENNELHIESEQQCVETSQSLLDVKEISKSNKVLQIETEELVVDDPNRQQSIVKDVVNHSKNKNGQSPKKHKQNKSPNSDHLKSSVKCVKQNSKVTGKKGKTNITSECAEFDEENIKHNPVLKNKKVLQVEPEEQYVEDYHLVQLDAVEAVYNEKTNMYHIERENQCDLVSSAIEDSVNIKESVNLKHNEHLFLSSSTPDYNFGLRSPDPLHTEPDNSLTPKRSEQHALDKDSAFKALDLFFKNANVSMKDILVDPQIQHITEVAKNVGPEAVFVLVNKHISEDGTVVGPTLMLHKSRENILLARQKHQCKKSSVLPCSVILNKRF